MLSEYAVGGVILFDRNLETAEGVRRFTKELQEARHGKLPLLIAIDEEGGLVARMKDILPPPPAQSEVGKSGDAALARKWARETGEKLREFGFNLNFAPVADVGDGTRFYSDDPETVTDLSAKPSPDMRKREFSARLSISPVSAKAKRTPTWKPSSSMRTGKR